MTERHLHSDPPTSDEIAAATADIEAAVAVALQAVSVEGVRTLVGLAGSVTTVTAQAWSLPYYDARRIHLAVTPVPRMRQAARDLLGMTRAHRAALPFMHPGRVDVIGAGALVWDVVIGEVGVRSGRGDDLIVVSSEHDILDGLALSLV
jgi:exopolyphosphatase / guanosine-5'-triphosphate,3'-diphosphate pyrophosphatase